MLRILGSTSALRLGTILSSKITKKKHRTVKTKTKKQKTWHSKEHEKDAYLRPESWNKKAECRLFSLSWEHAHWVTRNLCCSERSVWLIARTPGVLILALQINFSDWVILQIWNLQIMRIDYIERYTLNCIFCLSRWVLSCGFSSGWIVIQSWECSFRLRAGMKDKPLSLQV